MARIGQIKKRAPSNEVRLTDRISIGVLSEPFPRDLIEEILVETGRREQRSRLLPAHVMVRYAMALCLFFDDDYEEVMRKLVAGLQAMDSWRSTWKVPTTSAITQARQRLGADPLRVLFERTAVPVATHGTKGAWLGGRRLMAIDGFFLDVPDTPANTEAFGRLDSGPKAGAFPKVLIVGLGECGSHAIVDATMDHCRAGEQALVSGLLDGLGPGMLVLADRNFYSYQLWHDARETGADLLWRVTTSVELPVLEILKDGSWRSMVINPTITGTRRDRLIDQARAGHPIADRAAIEVRVLEYTVPDRAGNGKDELITLITTIGDPAVVTAVELAAAYHERWEFETALDELETHQRGPGRVLRSKSPEMVRQEIWALLLTHYAIRRLMTAAADEAEVDPDRLSFMRALRIVRRQLTEQAGFSP
jgi:Insertion element 4 transposase N-terminal/Transposase DDE domain